MALALQGSAAPAALNQTGQLYNCTIGIVMELCEHGKLQNFLAFAASLFGNDRCKLRTEGMRQPAYILSGPQAATEEEAMAMLIINSWPARLRLAREIASALAACHAESVLHRDLTSYNVMLTQARGEGCAPSGDQLTWQEQYIDSEVDGAKVAKVAVNFGHPWTSQLIDFGLAAFTQPQSQTCSIDLHSPNWMAPETKAEVRQHWAASDVYSFGIVLFELVTLSPPPTATQQGHTTMASAASASPHAAQSSPHAPGSPAASIVSSLMGAVTTEQAGDLLHALPCPVLPELCHLILHCIHHDPGQRLEASAAVDCLDRLIEQCLANPPGVHSPIGTVCPAEPIDVMLARPLLQRPGQAATIARTTLDNLLT